MRTYGRITNKDGSRTWVVVETAPDGDNSAVYLTALAQTLQLNLNESPFYGSWGLPAIPAARSGIPPDYNMMLTQRRYAAYFASLLVARANSGPYSNRKPPVYSITATTKQGSVLTGEFPT